MAKEISKGHKPETKRLEKVEEDLGKLVEKIVGSSVKGKIDSKRKKIRYFYLGSLVVLLALAGVFLVVMCSAPEAKIGDKVQITYFATFENGTKFDNGTIEVRLGEGQIIPGLESGIYGMREGDSKKVTVEPRYAYGDWSTGNLDIINASYTINRWFDLPYLEANLTEGNIKKGDIIKVKGVMWPVKISDFENSAKEVRLENLPVVNSLYYDPFLTWWPVRILEIQEKTIAVRHEPKIGSVLRKKFSSGEILAGTVIKTDYEQVVVDFNHPLAGKTLIFDVKLDKILQP